MFNHIPPEPFNRQARPGYGKALSHAYSEWSYANPGHSLTEGMAKHKEIAKDLEKLFPTYEELDGPMVCTNVGYPL